MSTTCNFRAKREHIAMLTEKQRNVYLKAQRSWR